MEEEAQTTPFWLQQSSTYFQSSNNRRRRSSSSNICLNSGVLIVVLLVFAIVTIFIVIPSILAFTSQVFRPNLVRKSWDSLNLVLVLFAILCGLLSRKRDDGESVAASGTAEQVPEEPQQQQPVQQQWFGYSDNRMDNEPIQMAHSNSVSRGRLKRNSSSYPDLRQESSWASPDDNWRYFDDSYVYNRRLGSDYVHQQRHKNDHEVVQEPGIKTIPVDTYVIRQPEATSSPSSSLPQPSTPPPPPPPPPRRPLSEMKPKAIHDFQSVGQMQNIRVKEMELKKNQSPPPAPPPPPASVAPQSSKSEKKSKKHERKRSGGAKDITSTLASLYNQRKRKKKQKSKENFDDVFYSPAYLYSGPPTPPPPPPPPPASVFQQLFKKSSKSKKIHSLSASSPMQQQRPTPPPPPPPPPPPMSPLHPIKRKTHTRPMPQPTSMPQPPPPPPPAPPSRSRKPTTPGKPPLPSKINSFYEESYNAGNQSPLIPMPPPPPPPPFKVPGFKFVVKGDYVRLLSNQNSRSTSPDLESTETPPTSTPATPTSTDDGEAGGSVFCPSPDVNTKADTFIARFRAGLRMEKVHSFKEKQESFTSGLKPSPRSNQHQS